MPIPHTERMLANSHSLIVRWAGGSKMWLRREGSTDRLCTGAILDVNPRDRDLVMLGAKRVVISGKSVTVAPDRELDSVVFQPQGSTEKLLYNFYSPIRGPRPAGVAIYYECEVLYDTREL